MNLAAVDLNLLVALDALLEERNVSRAAARVGLSQSGMSNALRRLRDTFGDALLVRTADGMMPTERAERLRPCVREALEQIRRALEDEPAFDPGTARRTIRVGTADYIELVVMPRAIQYLAEHAPGMDIEIGPIPHGIHAEDLRSGRYDLIIGSESEPAPPIQHCHIFEEEFVCIARAGHPVVKKRLTARQFSLLGHVMVSPINRPGPGAVDRALAAVGLSRRVVVVSPHFLVVPMIVAQSDYIATIPRRIADALGAPLGLQVFRPPIEVTRFPLRMVWHNRTDSEPAHRWVRGVIMAICQDL